MPSALPDPVLALSMANLQKLNTADVDQLANLWHLFTKCKESIESGRRLENLSWRLWFREAHVLPPDTSLSDLTDFTPLDTPLMSRRSSLSGSYQPTRILSPLTPHQPSAPVTPHALQAAALAIHGTRATAGPSMAAAPTDAAPLSDPEDGEEWSSDDETADDDDEGDKDASRPPNSSLTTGTPASAGRGRSHARSPLTSPPTTAGESAQPKATSSVTASTSDAANAMAKRRMASLSSDAGEARDAEVKQNGTASPATATLATAGDRRRAISSSSAFGSRARVKQHNMQRRRRPLSLQQAIEGLLLGCEDLTWSATKSRKNADKAAEIEATVSENELEHEERPQVDLGQPLQNSAPAEFSQPSTPQQHEPLTAPVLQPRQVPEERVVAAVSEVDKTEKVATQQEKTKASSSKFFIGSTSFEGSEHSVGSESVRGVPGPTSTMPSEASPAKPSTERRHTAQQMRRAPSDAGSNDSSKVHGPRGAHQRSGAAAQRHGAHPTNHGAVHQLGHMPLRGAHAGARNKSAIGLIRPGAGARGRGHGRVASAVRIAPMMTKDDGKHDHQGHDSPSAVAPAAQAAVKATSPLQTKKKRAPVTFTMGSMEDDDSDFEDDDEAESKNAKGKAAEPAAASKGGAKAGPTETSDEWSSDSSTDSEEERRRTAEERKRAERERLDTMFKKIPVRSKSAADVSLLGGEAKKATTTENVESRHIAEMSTSPGSGQNGPPIRSLLSTIFHPESEQELSQAIRRAHASAVDLHSQQHRAPHRAKTTLPRPPSTSNFPASFGGALKMSKSAVALPVLSTTGSRSTVKDDVRNSRNSAVFDDDDDSTDEKGDDDDDDHRHGGNGAVERLNELAQAQQSRKKHKQKQLRRENSNASEQSDATSTRRASGDSQRKKRSSVASLDVQVTPDVDEDAIRQQRRTSAPSEMAGTPAIAAPDRQPYRSKSAVNVPEVGLPQSPRTTRRNMLRDELSESLRQNLLLERRSRQRMLGIGAQGPVMTSAAVGDAAGAGQQAMGPPMLPAPPHLQAHNRQQSVLGGNALRPLTARNGQPSLSSSQQQQQQQQQQQTGNTHRAGPSRYSGDFHQTGW